jgi:tetratricopeptide (TPR) repeat protein
MPEILISDLDSRLQKQVENARFAIDRGNLQYAIEICSHVLAQEPGCLPVRKLLRAAQMKLFRTKNKMMAKAIGGMSGAVTLMSASSKVKKEPGKALEAAEKALSKDPTNVSAHKMIAQAAAQLELPETVVFAWECIRDQTPENISNLLSLGQAYIDAQRGEEAVNVGEHILRLSPGNGDAQDLLKTGSVSQSLSRGNWEEESGTYRDKLKDASESIALEQAAKFVAAEDATQKLVADAERKVAEEPNNLNHYRAIVQGYQQLNNLPKAIEWLEKARKLPAGAADATLAKQQSDLRIKLVESRLSQKEAQLVENPDDATLQQEAQGLRDELTKVRVEEAQAMVDRYPNDPGYRYEFGRLLFEAGDVDRAIQQFQISHRSPKVRIASLTFLGACFKSKRQYDLALEQYETAKGEISAMNDQKKDIIYQLAECYELMDNREKAIAEYKLIYAADIGYRDVAAKIDEYYAKG